jgi:hypothetical protein
MMIKSTGQPDLGAMVRQSLTRASPGSLGRAEVLGIVDLRGTRLFQRSEGRDVDFAFSMKVFIATPFITLFQQKAKSIVRSARQQSLVNHRIASSSSARGAKNLLAKCLRPLVNRVGAATAAKWRNNAGLPPLRQRPKPTGGAMADQTQTPTAPVL